MIPPVELALPTKFTQSLSGDENFPSDFDWFEPVLDKVFAGTGRRGKALGFYNWQKWLFRHILEVYPKGHPKEGTLRFRQALILIGRQQGKTQIGAGLGIYGLTREPGDQLIGVASTAEQARILYNRTMGAIRSHKDMQKRFDKLTETRGIQAKTGSRYEIRASKGDALQGIPIELGLIDEVHIVKPAIHQALVAGTGARDDAIVIMISTAGDDASELLIDLYKKGDAAIDADPEDNRFGFFVFEAEKDVPKGWRTNQKKREQLIKLALQANPTMAEGHISVENFVADIETMHDDDINRYHLNRFVSSVSAFISLDQWFKCKNPVASKEPFPRPVFAIERTRDWSHASITANYKDDNGIIHTELIASINDPTKEQLVRICLELRKLKPIGYVMDRVRLSDVGKELNLRGLKNLVHLYSNADIINACSTFYSKIVSGKLRHPGDELLARQIPLVMRRNTGENFVISRTDSSSEIDGVYSTCFGVYGAETLKEIPLQMFIK